MSVVVEPAVLGGFIFCSKLQHVRFSVAIELLTRVVIANPRPFRLGVHVAELG